MKRASSSAPSDRRPRILIDALAYAPGDGGFTTAIHDLLITCSQLPEFEFVVIHDRRYRSTFRGFGLPTYELRVPRSLRFFASLVVSPFIARRLRASAFHCEISALPWLLGVPGSLTVNDLYFLMDPAAGGRTIRHRVMQWYWSRVFVASIRRARVLKAISETTADDVRRLVSPSLPIILGQPPVAAPEGSPRNRRPPAHGEDLRLLFVGSVVPRKNLPFLLRALKLVRRGWRLDVVGNLWWGADQVAKMQLAGRTHLHGYVSNDERERLMAHAHVLVAPSLYEGFGYPAAEAMIRGLPVLASDVGAFREFVPPEWRFPLNEPAGLASMIDDLDEAHWHAMSLAGPDAVGRFDRAHHVASHRRLFQKLVSASSEATDRARVWRPGPLDRSRAMVRRAVLSTLGTGFEGRLRGAYHRALRGAGRFGPPENASNRQLLALLASHAGTIVDVGANVGRYAWFLKQHAGSQSRLVALEPHPDAAALLRKTIGGLPGCSVLEVAAADSDEVAELIVPEGPFGTPLSALAWVQGSSQDHDGEALQVRARRLDRLIEDGTIPITPPVLVKIDVEGAEARVLQGATELLGRYRPVIYFECQADMTARHGATPSEVWAHLLRAGYRIFAPTPEGIVPAEDVRSDVVNYLALPILDRAKDIQVDGPLDAPVLNAIIDRWVRSGHA